MKKLSVKDFRAIGYLQEVNRQFLHPLGLALEVVVEEDGTERFGEVWDNREDPEGIAFDEGMIDTEKALRIEAEAAAKVAARLKGLGWVVQEVG